MLLYFICLTHALTFVLTQSNDDETHGGGSRLVWLNGTCSSAQNCILHFLLLVSALKMRKRSEPSLLKEENRYKSFHR